jgi:hypothetical protein
VSDPLYSVGIEFVAGSFTNVTSDVLRMDCERVLADVFNRSAKVARRRSN